MGCMVFNTVPCHFTTSDSVSLLTLYECLSLLLILMLLLLLRFAVLLTMNYNLFGDFLAFYMLRAYCYTYRLQFPR